MAQRRGGPAKNSKSPDLNLPKITRFFSCTGIVRSSSKTSFKTDEEIPISQPSDIMFEDDIENLPFEGTEKNNKITPQKPSQIQNALQAIYEDKTDTESANSNDNDDDDIRPSPPQQQTRRDLIYQLPHAEKERWRLKEKILCEFQAKTFKSNEIAIQKILELQRLQSTSYRDNVEVLRQFISLKEEEQKGRFANEFLPSLAALALRITELNSLTVLTRETPVVTLSKLHVASLLANMFFSTLASFQHAKDLPFGNSFRQIFAGSVAYSQNGRKIEKMKCLCHYFERIMKVLKTRPDELTKQFITLERLIYTPSVHQNANVSLFWKQSKSKLTKVTHTKNGNIEDYSRTIQVDFANEYIGGGVLDHGLVQEEIRFLVSPELIVSRLISPKMEDHEAIMMLGSEQFCKYEGYSNSFRFAGDLDESALELDGQGRKLSSVLAIDAINYGQSYDKSVQFKMQTVVREILKAYVGFEGGEELSKMETATKNGVKQRFEVSTGRWGCGIFNGDPQLKFLIQWIVASQADREMIFCSFQDKELDDLEEIAKLLADKTVGEVFGLIHKYTEFLNKQHIKSTLFQFIRIAVGTKK